MGFIKTEIDTNTGSAVGAAENGTSLVNPAPGDFRVVLGNDVGDNAAVLLSDREIPTDGNFIAMTGTGNLLLNSVTDQGDKLQVNGTVLQFDEQAPITDYNILDILGTSPLSDRPGITIKSSGGNCGIGFVNANYFVTVNPAINLTQSGAAGENIFIMDVPSVGGAGEMGLFADSGNGFVANTATHVDNLSTFQVQGNGWYQTGLGIATLPVSNTILALGPGDATLAPFNYQAGAVVAILVNGNKEFDGNNEFLTAGGVRYTLAKTLTATAALDFPNTAAQTSSDLTIPLTGAATGDIVNLGVPVASVLPDSCYTAFVSAANVITVRFNNYSVGAQDPASGTFRVAIDKY